MPLLQKYKLNITWGDQDLLNIIFHHNPGMAARGHDTCLGFHNASLCASAVFRAFKLTIVLSNLRVFFNSLLLERLLEFPCKWNYRPDHCIYGSNCASAEESGVYMLHGNRGVYHDHKQPAFRAVYEAIQKVGTTLHHGSVQLTLTWLMSACFILLLKKGV